MFELFINILGFSGVCFASCVFHLGLGVDLCFGLHWCHVFDLFASFLFFQHLGCLFCGLCVRVRGAGELGADLCAGFQYYAQMYT